MALAVVATAVPVSAQALSQSYHLNIPREPLDGALKDLAQQTGLQIARFTDVKATNALVGPVSGDMSLAQALTSLLGSSGLTYRMVNERTIAVVTLESASGSGGSASNPSQPSPSAPGTGDDARKERKNDSSGQFRLAQAAPGQASTAGSIGSQQKQAYEGQIQEVIVTAQKRLERVQDVPVPITVLSTDELARSSELRIQDYYNTVPGLNVSPMGLHSVETLSMRGITTGSFGNSPVAGVTLDDVPLGPSTSVGGGVIAPDPDPSDLARIEVLRGPQGTLYGASSLGGLLKFVTLDPSRSEVGGLLEAGTESIHNASDLGYTFRGAINAPLGDTLAVRVSGYTREDPGYIDNPVYNLKGVNETRANGGLLSALWRPTDTFSIKLSALYQDRKADGSSDVNVNANGYAGPPLGDLEQSYFPGIGGYEKKTEAYAATARLQVGSMELTSVTGYNVTSYVDTFDFSYAFGGFANSLFPGAEGVPIYEHGTTNKFSQELRLSMPLGSRIDWLLGGFYTHESSHYHETIYATDILTGDNLGVLYSNPDQPSTFKEYAAFTDFTFHITSQFDVQIGGRQSHIEQSSAYYVTTGPFVGGESINTPTATSYSPFTYLFTPQYRFSKDLMAYARLASGYRAGGGGSQDPTATCVVHDFPCSYGPDKTYNYEVGVKGDAWEHALDFDASVYYIDWKDIQVNAVLDGLYGYISNGGSARSDGAELSLDIRRLDRLTITARLAYTDAKLTENFPGYPNPTQGEAYGASGDPLPDTSKFTGYLAAERTFPLFESITGLLGADERCVSSHTGQFLTAAGPRQYFPPYAQTDVHAGLNYNGWSALLYANNITDRRGALAGGLGTYPPFAFTYIQPRTVGLTLTRSF